jgi:hypothetical protein
MAATKRRYIYSRRVTRVGGEPVGPPDAAYAPQRWIPKQRLDWLHECDRIMMAHGTVQGSKVYEVKNQARWRAESLIDLMVELRLHERWELRRHIERLPDGMYRWSVEFRGHDGEGRSNVN